METYVQTHIPRKKSKLIGQRTGCRQETRAQFCCVSGNCRKLGALENKELAARVNTKYKSISTSLWGPQDNQLYIYMTTMLIKKKYYIFYLVLWPDQPLERIIGLRKNKRPSSLPDMVTVFLITSTGSALFFLQGGRQELFYQISNVWFLSKYSP